MKSFIKVSLILLVLLFNINVYATNDNLDTNQNQTSGENGSDTTDDNTNKEGQTEDVVDEKNNDATLKDVVINGVTVMPNSDNELVYESIIKDNSVSEVVITYKTNDSKATLDKDKIEGSLEEGENTYKVVVTAEDGTTTKEYTFKITKVLLSTDSSLKKLVVNGSEVKLTSDTNKYEVSVSYAANKVEIEAFVNNEKATIQGFKDNKASYDFFDDTKVEYELKVEAEDGSMTTYVINVTRREEEDATLKKLKITNASIDFESGVFDYEITVLRNINKLDIEAEANDEDAEVKIENPNVLVVGENTVKIEVVNDGNVKTYTIKVTKLDEEDQNLANLKSLTIDGYTIEFKQDVYEYDLKIGDINYLVIDAIPKVEEATVDITGNLDLVDGSIIKIKVTYDEETSNIYRINIIKDEVLPDNDNDILLIIIISVTALLVIVIVIIIVIIVKKKKNKKNNKNDKEETKEEVNNQENREEIISITDDVEIEDII